MLIATEKIIIIFLLFHCKSHYKYSNELLYKYCISDVCFFFLNWWMSKWFISVVTDIMPQMLSIKHY